MKYVVKGETGKFLASHEDTRSGCRVAFTDTIENAARFSASRIKHVLSDMRPARPPIGNCEAVEVDA